MNNKLVNEMLAHASGSMDKLKTDMLTPMMKQIQVECLRAYEQKHATGTTFATQLEAVNNRAAAGQALPNDMETMMDIMIQMSVMNQKDPETVPSAAQMRKMAEERLGLVDVKLKKP